MHYDYRREDDEPLYDDESATGFSVSCQWLEKRQCFHFEMYAEDGTSYSGLCYASFLTGLAVQLALTKSGERPTIQVDGGPVFDCFDDPGRRAAVIHFLLEVVSAWKHTRYRN